jgi:hypothetical protein
MLIHAYLCTNCISVHTTTSHGNLHVFHVGHYHVLLFVLAREFRKVLSMGRLWQFRSVRKTPYYLGTMNSADQPPASILSTNNP